MSADLAVAAARLTEQFLARLHLCRPDDLADLVAEVLEDALEAADVVLYLVSREETTLLPVPCRRSPDRAPHPVDGTLAGRSFAATAVQVARADDPDRRRLWVPLIDGTDRLGVLELSVPARDGLPADLLQLLQRFGHMVAQAVLSKAQYGDAVELVRRTRPMDLSAELLWSVLPPLTFATDGLVISAMLEPAYEHGGDAFDYAVNGDRIHLAVLDGMGHGRAAASVATFAIAAYRHCRRAGQDLATTCEAMDAAIGAQFGGSPFATALLAELELDSGRLRWLSAGHPPPLLIRHNHVVKTLEVRPTTPLGVPAPAGPVAVGSEQLETGDSVLLYTDGLTEARQPDGSFLTLQGLAEFVEHEAAAQRPPPETLRRLRRSVLHHQQGRLDDDATALLVDWRRGSEHRVLPQTVEQPRDPGA